MRSRGLIAALLAALLLMLPMGCASTEAEEATMDWPVRIMATFAEGVDATDPDTLARIAAELERPVEYARQLSGERNHLITIGRRSGDDPEAFASTLAGLDFIERAEPDRRRYHQSK